MELSDTIGPKQRQQWYRKNICEITEHYKFALNIEHDVFLEDKDEEGVSHVIRRQRQIQNDISSCMIYGDPRKSNWFESAATINTGNAKTPTKGTGTQKPGEGASAIALANYRAKAAYKASIKKKKRNNNRMNKEARAEAENRSPAKRGRKPKGRRTQQKSKTKKKEEKSESSDHEAED